MSLMTLRTYTFSPGTVQEVGPWARAGTAAPAAIKVRKHAAARRIMDTDVILTLDDSPARPARSQRCTVDLATSRVDRRDSANVGDVVQRVRVEHEEVSGLPDRQRRSEEH